MRAGVIGAGVAGLVTAKVLKHDGFDVTVFEKEPTVGGVWAVSRAYPGLRTNNPRETYVFSDFPHAESADEFPTAAQVRGYLDAYVDHFGLGPHLRLATEVISVSRRKPTGGKSHPGFQVTTRSFQGDGKAEHHYFDFVVVCNGVLSEPYLPGFDGEHRFSGSIIHSSQIPNAQSLEGKRVIVVGAGKSGLDCAAFAGREAASCTLVFRRPHWMLPRYFGRARVDRAVFTRLAEMLLPAFHEMTRTEAFARWVGRPLLPLLWLQRRMLRRRVVRECGIPDAMVPSVPIHARVYNLGIGAEIYDSLRGGLVHARSASIDSFPAGDRVRLDTGEEIGADLVICATGWRQNVSFLDRRLQSGIQQGGRFRLYRHILPVNEQHLGFVGYASSSSSPLTSEVSAHWLSQCFRGELNLPDRVGMEQSIDRVLDWTASTFPDHREGHFIGAYIAHYTDWLMRDMGLSTRRYGSLVSEYLGPFWSERYRGLADERRRARRGG